MFVSIFFFLLSAGSLFRQNDEQLGLHSEGGPWKFYPVQEVNTSLPKVLLIGNSVKSSLCPTLYYPEGFSIGDGGVTGNKAIGIGASIDKYRKL